MFFSKPKQTKQEAALARAKHRKAQRIEQANNLEQVNTLYQWNSHNVDVKA